MSTCADHTYGPEGYVEGVPKSPEHRAKLSAALKGRPQGAAQRAAAPGNLARWYETEEGKAFRQAHLAKLRDEWANIKPGQVARMDFEGAVHSTCPVKRPPCPHCFLVHAITQDDCDG